MSLQVSTGKDTQNKGKGDFIQEENNVELANIYESLQDQGDDVHPYSNTVRSGADAINSGANKDHPKSSAYADISNIKFELSCKVICMALTGILLFCTLICVITGFVVYHLTTAKMSECGTQISQNQNITSTTNNHEALAMDVKSLKTEINQLNDVWKHQLSSLSNVSHDFQMNTNNQLDTLTNASRDTNSQLDTLNNASRDTKNQLETLNNTSRDFQIDTNNQLDTLTNASRDTKNQLETLNNASRDTNSQLDTLTNASRDTDNQLETIRTLVQAVQETQNISGQQVAFTANGATGKLANSVLTFRNVYLNLGGGYDKTTGRFTCHVAGTYLFSATLVSVRDRSGYTYCSIRKNASTVVIVYSEEGAYDSASVSTLVHLSVGDYVDLGISVNVNYIYTGDGYTSFTGSLIQAD